MAEYCQKVLVINTVPFLSQNIGQFHPNKIYKSFQNINELNRLFWFLANKKEKKEEKNWGFKAKALDYNISSL